MKYKVKYNELKAIDYISLSKSVGFCKDKKIDLGKLTDALNDTSFVVSIEVGEVIIACIRAFSDDLTTTFIPDLFVHPKWQKKGIGKLLMEKVKEKYGHTTIILIQKEGSDGFYQKVGYKKSDQSYSAQFEDNPYYT